MLVLSPRLLNTAGVSSTVLFSRSTMGTPSRSSTNRATQPRAAQSIDSQPHADLLSRFFIRFIKNGRERSFFWRRKVFWSHDKADLLMRVSYRLFVGFAAAANFLMERRKKNSETAFFLSGPESGSFSSSQLRSLSIFNWFIWKWSFFLGGVE